MTETDIPPIVFANELANGLKKIISMYISNVILKSTDSAEVQDWAKYHRCTGKIEAYAEVLRIINESNISKGE